MNYIDYKAMESDRKQRRRRRRRRRQLRFVDKVCGDSLDSSLVNATQRNRTVMYRNARVNEMLTEKRRKQTADVRRVAASCVTIRYRLFYARPLALRCVTYGTD